MSFILDKLLEKLRERHSYCPYCGSEYVCESKCILKNIWFKGVEATGALECQDCREIKPDVSERECPFQSEVYGETLMIQVCDSCHQERVWEV